MEVDSASSQEASEDSDMELDAATANQYLCILGKSRNLMKREDLKYVGDIKDHLEECRSLLKGLSNKGKKK